MAYPGEDQAEVTLDAGIRSGRSYDKFAAHNLTIREGECCQTPIWQSSDDRRPLLLVEDLGGYEQLLKGGRYQFGVIGR